MGGNLYYTFTPYPDVRFFMLETSYPTPEQFTWLEKELKASRTSGRSSSSTTRCTRRAIGMARTFACEKCSSRSS